MGNIQSAIKKTGCGCAGQREGSASPVRKSILEKEDKKKNAGVSETPKKIDILHAIDKPVDGSNLQRNKRLDRTIGIRSSKQLSSQPSLSLV